MFFGSQILGAILVAGRKPEAICAFNSYNSRLSFHFASLVVGKSKCLVEILYGKPHQKSRDFIAKTRQKNINNFTLFLMHDFIYIFYISLYLDKDF